MPRTGQVTIFSAGDDGDLQIGTVLPASRFTNPDGTTPVTSGAVVDQLTGLMWTQDGRAPGPASCTTVSARSWPAALSYVDCLNSNNYLGYADWRLPNRKELMSLIDYSQASPAIWLNTHGFMNVQSNPYWSSTTIAGNPATAWDVNMQDGVSWDSLGKVTDNLFVWPVRGGH